MHLLLGCASPSETDREPRPTNPPEPGCSDFHAPVATARLLSRREYAHTIQDLFALPEADAEELTAEFPREARVEGFDNNAISHNATPLLVERHAATAAALADRLRVSGIESLSPCTEATPACAAQVIEELGRRAFRRPLTTDESLAYTKLYTTVATPMGHLDGVTAFVEALLLSPQFLYRVESPLTEPTAEPSDKNMVPLGPYELATRLSYFLWGSTPDEQLLDSAESGDLLTEAGLEAQARRLLQHAHAQRQVRDFHKAWLGLEAMPDLQRDGAPPDAPAALQESLLQFIDATFWSETGTVTQLLTSPIVFTDHRIGSLYGGPENDLMLPFEAASRGGLLTQPGLLTLLSHPDQSSPIRRGVFVRDKILCDPVRPPPPDTDNSPPDPDPTLTTRERFRVHTQDRACAGCHFLIDPVGFTFEGYDQLGRVRGEENGSPIDTSGELAETADPALNGPLSDAIELGDRLASSPIVLECLSEKWLTFALGRTASSGDTCELEALAADVQEHGGRLQDILLQISQSPLFRYRRQTPEEQLP